LVSALLGKRAVIAKLGMDAHWRGAILIARTLRAAGMEVVYLGHATADQIAAAVLEEDVNLVGLSTLSGNHATEVPPVVERLQQGGGGPVIVVGGAIPPVDAERLRDVGVHAVFPTGTPTRFILDELSRLLNDQSPKDPP
jgi:methylmalonyl-CoA mutase C-terminal domain/subunit